MLAELLNEIEKYDSGGGNLVDIGSSGRDLRILKAYLSSGKVRAAILLKVRRDVYIPFLIARKESRKGWNLSKYSEDILCERILRVQKEIEKGNFEEWDV